MHLLQNDFILKIVNYSGLLILIILLIIPGSISTLILVRNVGCITHPYNTRIYTVPNETFFPYQWGGGQFFFAALYDGY